MGKAIRSLTPKPKVKRTTSPRRSRAERLEAEDMAAAEIEARKPGARHRRAQGGSAHEPFAPRNGAQARYTALVRACELVFGVGPAGTGKTYCAVSLGVEGLVAGRYERFIATRPIVEAGERLGFLPGTQDEKIAPYFAPVRDVLERRLGAGHVEAMLRSGKISFLPLAFMRGTSIDNAFILLDEAQNTTPTQMKMFLTRKGEGTTMLVDGDPTQLDLPPGQPSGLIDGLRKAAGLEGVGLQIFEEEDVVRSGLVQRLVARYRVRDADFEAELAEAIRLFEREEG